MTFWEFYFKDYWPIVWVVRDGFRIWGGGGLVRKVRLGREKCAMS